MKWRLLMGAVALASAGWFGWWFIGSAAQERALESWFAERRAAGWQADYTALAVGGFPNRFDAEIAEPALADPRSGWAWSAPGFQILQQSWEPTFAILVFPPEQRVAAPGARATVRSDRMLASLRFAPGDGGPALVRAAMETDRLAIAADAGWTGGAERIAADVALSDPAFSPAHSYDVRLDASALRLPRPLLDRINPAGAAPERMEALRFDGRAAFEGPLDLAALEGAKPALIALSIRRAEAVWGGLELSFNGALRGDAEGFAEGRLDITAKNWREMLALAASSGAIPQGLADALETGLGFVAGLGGDGRTLTAPLTFDGGYAKLGPVPIGPAPRMGPAGS